MYDIVRETYDDKIYRCNITRTSPVADSEGRNRYMPPKLVQISVESRNFVFRLSEKLYTNTATMGQ